MNATSKPKIRVRITHKPELYCGEKTGSMYFTCETVVPADGLSAVLGRDYTEQQSIDDFIFRARADGAKVEYRDMEITQRHEQTF